MGKKQDNVEQPAENLDFSEELIASLNKEFQTRVAYNLATTESPTHVKHWISTGSLLLDYAVANQKNGGLPDGRVIEIFGEPATGKSHLAFSIARTIQQMGGIVVYCDTERAVPLPKLKQMGIDVSKRFVYCTPDFTEEVFQIAEKTIAKAKQLNNDAPILFVWDSVAQTSPKMEFENDFDQNTVGLQARVISKGVRKIVSTIANNNVLFLCLNQTRTAINAGMFQDPTVVPGGKGIPFAASVRISLTGGNPVKNGDGVVIGSKVNVTIKKNKVGPPFRKFSMQILFGRGLYEDEELYDTLTEACKKGPVVKNGVEYRIEGGGAWKTFIASDEKDASKVLATVKFTKSQFREKVLENPEIKDHAYEMIDTVLVIDTDGTHPVDTSGENDE